MRKLRLLISALSIALGLRCLAGAPTPPFPPFELPVSGLISPFALAADQKHVIWAAFDDDGFRLLSVALASGAVAPLRDLPELQDSPDALTLRPLGTRSSRLVLGAHFPSAIGDLWCLWLMNPAADFVMPLGSDHCATDGAPALSPSGKFVVVESDFNCVGGGHDCAFTGLAVIDAVTGKTLFSLPFPQRTYELSYKELLGDPAVQGAELRRVVLVDSIGWCPNDILVVTTETGIRAAYAPARDGSWRQRPGVSTCVPVSKTHPYPLIDQSRQSTVLHGSRLVVTLQPVPPFSLSGTRVYRVSSTAVPTSVPAP